MRRLDPLLATVLFALLPGCPGFERPRGLEVSGPTQLRFALKADELCSRLDVKLTFDKVGDLGGAQVDELLVPVEGSSCTWKLAKTKQIFPGTYDLVVRFTTRGSFGSSTGPILVGMYVRRNLGFPFPEDFEGLTDEDFLSEPADSTDPRLAGEKASFDDDLDGLSNLDELLAGSNPSPWTTLPKVSVTTSDAALEGQPMTLSLHTQQDQDAPFTVRLTLKHAQAGYRTAQATLTVLTDDGAAPVVAPAASSLSWREQWRLEVAPRADAGFVDADGKGGRTWTVRFTPDEPFVGMVSVEAEALDGDQRLASGKLSFSVAEDAALDPPRFLLLGPADTAQTPIDSLTPVDSVGFAEGAGETQRFVVADASPGSASSTWTPTLQASGPRGLAFQYDKPVGTLTWAPDNDQAVEAAPHVAGFDLRDAADLKATAKLTLKVSPPRNDAPVVGQPAAQFLALPDVHKPGAAFSEALLPFVVEDADEVPERPTCEVVGVKVTSPTACTPFAEMTCQAAGSYTDRAYKPGNGLPDVHAARLWPFTLSLKPSATYASCGSKPTFTLTVKATDTAPAGASNAALPATADFTLRTVDAVTAYTVAGAPDDVTVGYVDGAVPDGAGGTVARGVFATYSGFAFAELEGPQSGFKAAIPLTTLDNGSLASPAALWGATDVVGHRAAVFGNILPTGYDDALAVFDLAAMSLVATETEDAVFGFSNTYYRSNVAADPRTGSFYLLCSDSSGSSAKTNLVRDQAPHSMTRAPVSFKLNSDPTMAAVVPTRTAPGVPGPSWMVSPNRSKSATSFFAADLSTFDGTLTTKTVAFTADFMEDFAVDTERGAYLFVYFKSGSDDAFLGRIRFDTGAPVADPELPLGLGYNSANVRTTMALRRPYARSATPPPHLVVSLGTDGGASFYPVLWVDLDQWKVVAVTPGRTTGDYHFGTGGDRFDASPDRRYFLQTVSGLAAPAWNGEILHGWTDYTDVSPLELPDTELKVNLIEDTLVSYEGNLCAMPTQAKSLRVLKFTEAALGLDE